MLILSRRLGETICIGSDITMTVFEVNQGRVKLGIDAPKDVVVNREEVHRLLQQKTACAVQNKGDSEK